MNYVEQSAVYYPTVFVVPDGSMVAEAVWVSEMTSKAGTMLPKTVEQVLALFAEGKSILILDEKEQPIAHAAITFLYEEDQMLEIGGLFVKPEKRSPDHFYSILATQAILTLANERYPGWKKMALCNDKSLPILLKFGAEVIGLDKASLLPKAVWEACTTCPNLERARAVGKLCCDTLAIIP